jgi:hypothetical protein
MEHGGREVLGAPLSGPAAPDTPVERGWRRREPRDRQLVP